MEKLLVTGEPGVGKSTLIDKLYKEHTAKVVGIVAREIRDENGQRQGFTSGTFEKPNLHTIAHVNSSSDIRMGRYGVSTKTLDDLADLLANQLQTARDEKLLLVFDEVGWIQTFSEKLKQQIENVLRSGIPAIMTIKQDDSMSEWLKRIKKEPNVRIITVTNDDRESAFNELEAYIQNNS